MSNEEEYVIDYERYIIKVGNIYSVEPMLRYEKEKNFENIKYYFVYIDSINAIYIFREDYLPWIKIFN